MDKDEILKVLEWFKTSGKEIFEAGLLQQQEELPNYSIAREVEAKWLSETEAMVCYPTISLGGNHPVYATLAFARGLWWLNLHSTYSKINNLEKTFKVVDKDEIEELLLTLVDFSIAGYIDYVEKIHAYYAQHSVKNKSGMPD